MDITLSKEEAQQSFLQGAKHVATFAGEIQHRTGLKQFIHIVGYMSPFTNEVSVWEDHDVFTHMHPLLMGDSFYEQMKFQADIYMRQIALQENFPLTVINPPTVIGNRQTGDTAQLTGFGLFIKIIRGGYLPVIPGGKTYRLPVIHNDVFAAFMLEALFHQNQSTATYTLVQDQPDDRSLPEMMRVVTAAMHMSELKIVVPISFLKTIMTLGGSRFTGVAKESLHFLTDRHFDNQQVKTDFSPTVIEQLFAPPSLPFVVADIDHRLTFGNQEIAPYTRTIIGFACVYQIQGEGDPIVLIHGLFSEGADLFALGIALHETNSRPIWIVDLPGFGRSPFQPADQLLNPYIQTIERIQQVMKGQATFIGHSFGAALLLQASEKQLFSDHQNLLLLQPPVGKARLTNPIWLTKGLLKSASMHQVATYFSKQGLFSTDDHSSASYFLKLKRSTKSPRILRTNMTINRYLNKMNFRKTLQQSFPTIWGSGDKQYNRPEYLSVKETVPYGHYFPISHPEETATSIDRVLNREPVKDQIGKNHIRF